MAACFLLAVVNTDAKNEVVLERRRECVFVYVAGRMNEFRVICERVCKLRKKSKNKRQKEKKKKEQQKRGDDNKEDKD